MLILTPAARDRIAAAVSESLNGQVLAVATAGGVSAINVEIGEFPIFEVTPDGVRLGVWINMAPALAEALTVAAAAGDPRAAWDGVTPVDAQRFDDAPCYLCGYNGPGYFQADTHSCAAGYHAAVARLSRVDPA